MTDAKPKHFMVLDALRGVAAIAVTAYHACIVFGSRQLLPSAFLAVDFFFLLSGVVVAHAYEQRLNQGKRREYFERRIIRLYPMILAGALLGMSVILTSAAARSLAPGALLYLGVFAALCLPILRGNVYPGTESIAPVNGPSWSLFFEIFVNAVYGFIARQLTTRRLAAIALVAFVVETAVTLQSDSVNVGIHVADFKWGFARVSFPFFTGVLINRLHAGRAPLLSSIAPLLLAISLLATFYLPALGVWSRVGDLLAIGVVYPCVIILAMRVAVSFRQGGMLAWLGAVSYPLYAIHFPLLMWLARLQRGMVSRLGVSLVVWIGAGVVFCLVCAWTILRVYDLPVREYLTARFKRGHQTLLTRRSYP